MNKLAGLFALICVVVNLPSFGQGKVQVLEELNSGVMSAPTIAINPRNPLSIVAAVGDRVFVSNDGGGSWQKKALPSTFTIIGDPIVAADGKGTFYLFHLSNKSGTAVVDAKSPNAISCYISSDYGQTWDQGNVVFHAADKALIHPNVCLDSKGTLYVSWTQLDKLNSDDPSCQSAIFLSTSGNGKKWGSPTQISQEPGKCVGLKNIAGGSMPAAGDEKHLFVTWANRDHLYIDRSFDGGHMWLSTDLLVTTQHDTVKTSSTGLQRYNGMPITVIDRSKTARNGLLYMTYADKVKDRMAIFFVRSHDFADHWTPPTKVIEAETQGDQFMPWITIDRTDGAVYIAYFQRAEDNRTDIILAQSNNAGNSFTTSKINEAVLDMPGEITGSLNISVHKGHVAVIWSVVQEGKTIIATSVTPPKTP
jgi:hypothetical protein